MSWSLCPVVAVILLMSSFDSLLAVLFRLSCFGCPFWLSILLLVSYCGCPSLGVLLWLSCSVCLVPLWSSVLFWCLVHDVLLWLPSSKYTIFIISSIHHFPYILSWLSSFELSFSWNPVLAVLFFMSCFLLSVFDCQIQAVLFWLSCNGYSVTDFLVWLSSCPVISVHTMPGSGNSVLEVFWYLFFGNGAFCPASYSRYSTYLVSCLKADSTVGAQSIRLILPES